MGDSDSRLILEKKSTGQTLFNISFPEYIGMIGTLYTAIDDIMVEAGKRKMIAEIEAVTKEAQEKR